MAGFVSAVTLAIPLIEKVVQAIKNGIDTKTATEPVKNDASAAATKVAGKQKGPATAQAVTPVVKDAAKAAVDEATSKLFKEYGKAQEELSVQLGIAADFGSFFEAEDNLYAMTQLIIYKEDGRRLDEEDIALLKKWWKTAAKNLETIGKKEADISKLEDPEKDELEFVIKAVNNDDIVTTIGDALKDIDSKNPKPTVLHEAVNGLYKDLHKATFSALSILKALSKGLKIAADAASQADNSKKAASASTPNS